MKQNKFKIYTLGCKVNQYDSADLNRKMIAAGFTWVEKGADIVIVNTCCVTKTAISKCKRMINKARAENPKAKVIVMGCWPKAYKSEVKKLGVDPAPGHLSGASLIWGVGELDKLVKGIKILCDNCRIATFDLEARNRFLASKSRIVMTDGARYFIKIQDGCEQFCSYCIIPYTRGKLKSRPMQEVIDEVRQAVKAGYREVVLCGIHLGLYAREGLRESRRQRRGSAFASPPAGRAGATADKEGHLVDLLKELIKIKDLGRIRLSSIEVTEVSNELINLIFKSKKICKHLHIPLQSGSDKILQLMNRPYNVKYFRNKIKQIRKLVPPASPLTSQGGDIAITTDVIIGFPGETKKDFQETCDFIKEMQFSRLHVFPFSAHEKTAAAKMGNKVEKEEIAKRAKKLRQLGKKLESDFRKKFVGQELAVVVEGKIKDTRCPTCASPMASARQVGHRVFTYKGKTEYYFDIEFKRSQIISKQNMANINEIVTIRFDKI